MAASPTRAEISEKVIQLFVDIIGFIDRSQVTEQTDFIHDFKIIDDDLTCKRRRRIGITSPPSSR